MIMPVHELRLTLDPIAVNADMCLLKSVGTQIKVGLTAAAGGLQNCWRFGGLCPASDPRGDPDGGGDERSGR